MKVNLFSLLAILATSAVTSVSAFADAGRCASMNNRYIEILTPHVRFPNAVATQVSGEVFANGTSSQIFVRIEKSFADTPGTVDGFFVQLGRNCEVLKYSRWDGRTADAL